MMAVARSPPLGNAAQGKEAVLLQATGQIMKKKEGKKKKKDKIYSQNVPGESGLTEIYFKLSNNTELFC